MAPTRPPTAALITLPPAPPGGCITTALCLLAAIPVLILLGPGIAGAPLWLAYSIPVAALLAIAAAAALLHLRTGARLARRRAIDTLTRIQRGELRPTDNELATLLAAATGCTELNINPRRADIEAWERRIMRTAPRIWIANDPALLAALRDPPPLPDPAPTEVAVFADDENPLLRIAALAGTLAAVALFIAAAFGPYALGWQPLGAFAASKVAVFVVVGGGLILLRGIMGASGWTLALNEAPPRLVRHSRRGTPAASYPIDPRDTLIILTPMIVNIDINDNPDSAMPDADLTPPGPPSGINWSFFPPPGTPPFGTPDLHPGLTPWHDALRAAVTDLPRAPAAANARHAGPPSAPEHTSG